MIEVNARTQDLGVSSKSNPTVTRALIAIRSGIHILSHSLSRYAQLSGQDRCRYTIKLEIVSPRARLIAETNGYT